MVPGATKQNANDFVAVNGDIVGYSRLMADDPETTTTTMEGYHRLVDRRIADSSGRLVNFVGDSFMAVFEDAKEAIRSAIAISHDIEAINADRPSHRWARFRIGIDRGTVTTSGDQYFGDALNIASRIQERAPAGGIGVSGRVYRALDEPLLRFRSAGQQNLKGIPEPTEIFEYIGLPTETPAGAGVSHRLSLEIPTIVILPIHTETVGDQVRVAADILREDLIHHLVGLPRLTVIDADNPRPVESGSAHYMLETGVHQFGDDVRVYAKVMQMATLNIVTSHKWATKADQLFAMADQITEEVSRSIEIELVIGEQARIYADYTDPETVAKIYQGWYHMSAETPEGWRRAVELFEEVAQEHPEAVYGHVLSAFANWMGVMEGFANDPEAVLDKAFDQAAVVMDRGEDPTGLAHMVHGAVYMLRGQPEDALRTIESVHITRPTCDLTYALEGDVRRYLGQFDKSVALMDTAMRLSAVTPPWYPSVQACSLFLGGKLDSAGATAAEVIEHSPNNLEALMVLAAVQTELGLERRARATADLIRERFPTVDIEKWLVAHPFSDRSFVDRWRADLVGTGLVGVR